MSLRQVLSSKISWMSAGVVVVVAGVLTATTLANAAAPPLPKRTPAQLLVAMRDAKFPAGFSGVLTESANLGFPAIPNIAGLSSPALNAASLLTGTHTVDVWYAGPGHVRIALPVSFGETDLRVNNRQVWLWDSHSQTATHYVLPALPTPAQLRSAKSARLRMLHAPGMRPEKDAGRIVHWKLPSAIHAEQLTPRQAVSRALKAIGPTTKVTVSGTAQIAGRAAYQLQIEPRSSQSLIDRIVIAVDAKTSLPLQLQVFGRGTASPAFQFGFTSLSLATPAGSNFTFTPPAGAHVKTERLPGLGALGGLGGIHGFPGVGGPGFHPIPQPVSPGQHPAGQHPAVQPPASHNPGGYPQPPGLRSPRLFPPTFPGGVLPGGVLPGMPSLGGFPFGLGSSGAQVLGSGWLSVAAFQTGPMLPVLGGMNAGHPQTPAKTRAVKFPAHHPGVIMARPASGSVVIMRAYSGPGRAENQTANEFIALIRVLLNAATPVHGSWGSGKLLRTSLFSVLMTSNGKVLIGAVTPAVLYADAAKVK